VNNTALHSSGPNTSDGHVDGVTAPDAIDMANWTDADWDAWLAQKQSETGSGA